MVIPQMQAPKEPRDMYRVAATVEQLKESTLAELQSPLCTLHMPYRYEGSHWVFRPGYTILVVQAWQQQPVPIFPRSTKKRPTIDKIQ